MLVKSPILNLNIESNKRVFIVGDLHGLYGYNILIKKLIDIGFDFENDYVVLTGDVIDKGIKSYKTFKKIFKKSIIKNLYSVRGNHEQMCINSFRTIDINYKKYHAKKGGDWFNNISNVKRECIARAFEELPIAIELKYNNKTYIVAHGTLPFDSWELSKEYILNDYMVKDNISARNYVMFSRDVYYNKKKNFINDIDNLFVGHTIVNKIKKKGNCIFLDTGLYKSGLLGLYEL